MIFVIYILRDDNLSDFPNNIKNCEKITKLYIYKRRLIVRNMFKFLFSFAPYFLIVNQNILRSTHESFLYLCLLLSLTY